MTPAEFIDLAVTPIAGGIGAAFGMHMYGRRQVPPLPRATGPLVGVAVAALLAVYKLFWGG